MFHECGNSCCIVNWVLNEFFNTLSRTLKTSFTYACIYILWDFPNNCSCSTFQFQWIRQLLSNIPLKIMTVNWFIPTSTKCLTSEFAVEYPLGLVLEIEGFYCHLKKQIHCTAAFPVQNSGLKSKGLSQPILWVWHHSHSHDEH